jgi:hypothetical protein
MGNRTDEPKNGKILTHVTNECLALAAILCVSHFVRVVINGERLLGWDFLVLLMSMITSTIIYHGVLRRHVCVEDVDSYFGSTT